MIWMSKNSREHYGFLNTDEILDIIGRACCGVFVVLAIIFIIML